MAANYIRAEDLLMEQGAVAGVKAKEVFSKTEFLIRTDMVINASGPWLEKVLQPSIHFPKPSLSWVKGINLIVHKPFFPGIWGGSPG